MATMNIPGLDVIEAAAARQNIDIGPQLAKLEQIMAIDTAGLRGGSARLRTMAAGLDTVQQDMSRTGSDLLAGWSGSAAEAFAPQHGDAVRRIADHKDKAGAIADHVDTFATGAERGQQAMLTATGIAATAIGAQQVAR